MNEYYYLKQYNDNNYRVICSKRDLKKSDKRLDRKNIVFEDRNKKAIDSEVIRISQSRVKRKIREYALCNDWDYFCTFTINSKHCDRFNLQQCQDNLTKIIQQITRAQKNLNLGKVQYLWVTEKHKNGAFHFHGLISNLQLGNYINDNGYMSNSYFDKLGYNSFSEIKNNTACANYIMKYITKDSIQNENGSYYFCSNGLKKAEELQVIEPIDFKIFMKPNGELFYYENEFCKVCDITIDRLPQYTNLYLQSNLKEKNNIVVDKLLKYLDNFKIIR